MSILQVFPYQGSKRQLAGVIIRFIPRGTSRLVEPFAGSAAVSIAAAQAARAEQFLLNDANKPLMDLWDRILNAPEDLASAYCRLWHEQLGNRRKYYDDIRDQFNRTRDPELLLYLLARCVKASVRYNAEGDFNQSPDNRRRGAQPDTMRKRIIRVHSILADRTRISARDYRSVLQRVGENDIVYMDPPYQGVSNERDPRYIKGVSFADFVEQLDALSDKGIPHIVSYDGRRGDNQYGNPLPASLGLRRLAVDAGASSQATLLGKSAQTVESLYVSEGLWQHARGDSGHSQPASSQVRLMEV